MRTAALRVSSRAAALRVLASAALLTGAALPARAQERPFPYTLGRSDALLLPSAAGVSLLAELVAPERAPLTSADIAPLSADDINPFDRVAARSWSESWGTVSDRGRDALLAASVLAAYAHPLARGRWREATTLGVMFAEAAFMVEGATYLAKDLTGRRRPWVYNASLSVEERVARAEADPLDARRSFFSGHASAAFTLATLMSTVYADVHGRSRGSDALWAASLSAAALTGVARVKAGAHYPSDVLAGALVGAAIGRVVPALHKAGRPPRVRLTAGPGGILVTVPIGGRALGPPGVLASPLSEPNCRLR